MNKFELFCLIYLALDADWDNTHDEELGRYLSDADPFLFADNTSAIKYVYNDYCSFIGTKDITKKNSFSIAKDYIKFLNIKAVSKSFSTLTKEQWLEAVEEYLSTEHKGA